MSQTPKYKNLASQALYDAAIDCINASEDHAARNALDRLYQTEPIDPKGNLLYGIIYVEEGQYEKGLEYLKKASEGGLQDNIILLFSCGYACYHLDKTRLATSFFNKVVKADPSHANALKCLGHIYHDAGQLNKAKNFYLKALELNGEDDADILSTLARVSDKQDDLEKAIDYMVRALKYNPSTLNHSYLGNLYSAAGRFNEGLKHDTMALVLNPSDPILHGNYAVALCRTKQDHGLVLQAVDKALELGQNNTLLHAQAAIILNDIGMSDRAHNVFQSGLGLAGEDTNEIKSYLCGSWNKAIRQNRPYGFIAKRLADLGVPVAVPHAPLLSFGQ